MKKLYPLIVIISISMIIIWQLFFTQANFYLVSSLILILSMLPLFASFEHEEHSAGELALIAGLIALAVVSRAAFYLVPQVKPIAAVVGVSGACLGARRGYLVGAFSMFVSNFLFGQGAWTPFQMVGMGLVGLVFGVLFKRLPLNRIYLAIVGFLSVTLIYGVIVDFCSVLFFNSNLEPGGIFSIYAAGLPFNLIFGAVTAICLLLFGETLSARINRLNIKYGLCKENGNG